MAQHGMDLGPAASLLRAGSSVTVHALHASRRLLQTCRPAGSAPPPPGTPGSPVCRTQTDALRYSLYMITVLVACVVTAVLMLALHACYRRWHPLPPRPLPPVRKVEERVIPEVRNAEGVIVLQPDGVSTLAIVDDGRGATCYTSHGGEGSDAPRTPKTPHTPASSAGRAAAALRSSLSMLRSPAASLELSRARTPPRPPRAAGDAADGGGAPQRSSGSAAAPSAALGEIVVAAEHV